MDTNRDVPLYFFSVPPQKVGCMTENPSFVHILTQQYRQSPVGGRVLVKQAIPLVWKDGQKPSNHVLRSSVRLTLIGWPVPACDHGTKVTTT